MTTTAPTRTEMLSAALLLTAPVASVAAIVAARGSMYLPSDVATMASIVAILAWSPLPIALPAVLLADARDEFEPEGGGLRRGLRLMRWLAGTECPRRIEFLASMLGVIAAGIIAFVGL